IFVFAQTYIRIPHIAIGIVELLIYHKGILIRIHRFFIQLQPLESSRQIEPGQLTVRIVVDDLLVKPYALLIPSRKVRPETYLVQRFLIARVLLQYELETIEDLVELFIVIIYVRQLEQKLYPFVPLEMQQSVLQQRDCFFLLIEGQVSICFEYVKID